ncbi:hypothetical protein ACQ33O_06720 [Ferruginibacter sp. SUN002]|uniref:hypothetical protein n=1 Tax=Ferruginibacter sp. SUN002 TaxID=2937789 RepID=UPI003D36A7DD
MDTHTKKSSLHPSVEQITNNTTSWIGHLPGDNKDVVGGQTFVATSEGDLEAIEVFPSVVTEKGKVVMTVHTFDEQQKSWGPALGTASVELAKADAGKWIAFNVPGLHLNKGKSYGFKLESDTYIGVGEAVGSHQQPPFINGQEWRFTNNNKNADSFSYFSLAFKVDLKAA